MTEVRALRAYADVALGRQRSPQHDSGPHMVSYLRAANVKDGVLDLSDVKSMNFDRREQVQFALRPGDVLVTEGSGSLSAVGASAVWLGECPGVVCFQNTLLRLRPRPSTDSRFLGWWCRYAFADGLFASIATGANIHHVSAERVRALPMVYLQPPEQRAIAAYLDIETARIDAIITKKRRMIELLEERFSSEVEASFSTWERVPLKRLVAWREGPGIMAADFRDEGVPLIRVSGVGGERVSLDGCNYLDPSEVVARWKHFQLHTGDYLISASASMGIVSLVDKVAAGAVPYTGLIIIRPRGGTNMEFIRWFLQSVDFIRQIDQLKTGTAIQHYGPTHLDQISAPAPPTVIQEQLGTRLLRSRRQADKLRSLLDRQIEALVEHRQALITAAVTGELEIVAAA